MRLPLALLFLMFASVSLADEPTTKPAVPSAAALRKAMAQVDQMYRQDFAKARDPQAKAALAKKVLDAGRDEQTVENRYALLNKAIQIAIQGGDAQTALSAVDQIDQNWNVDVLRLRAETLEKTVRYLGSADDQRAFVGLAQPIIDAAAADKKYDIARELNDAALAAAQRAKDTDLVKQLSARNTELVELRAAEARVSSARAVLKTRPQDPAAIAAVGRYECLIEDKWPEGLAKLAAGNDPTLKALAAKDLAENLPAAAKVAVADSWWDLSRQEAPIARRHIQSHAGEIYKALATDLTGPAKQRMEKRLAELADASVPKTAAAPAAAPSAAADAGPQVVVQNRTQASEAAQVVQEVLRDYPDTFKDIRQVTLMTYHDGSQLNHGPGGGRPMPGAFSFSPFVSTAKSFIFWGYSDQWKPGRYLVVYHMQVVASEGNANICTLDIYTDGSNVGRHMVKAGEAAAGQWKSVPMIVNITAPQNGEFRMYTNQQRTIALDRIYVYSIP